MLLCCSSLPSCILQLLLLDRPACLSDCRAAAANLQCCLPSYCCRCLHADVLLVTAKLHTTAAATPSSLLITAKLHTAAATPSCLLLLDRPACLSDCRAPANLQSCLSSHCCFSWPVLPDLVTAGLLLPTFNAACHPTAAAACMPSMTCCCHPAAACFYSAAAPCH